MCEWETYPVGFRYFVEDSFNFIILSIAISIIFGCIGAMRRYDTMAALARYSMGALVIGLAGVVYLVYFGNVRSIDDGYGVYYCVKIISPLTSFVFTYPIYELTRLLFLLFALWRGKMRQKG